MSRENVRCPVCSRMNKLLDLEETNGWMECDGCGNTMQLIRYEKTWLLPKRKEENLFMMVPIALA